MDKIERANKVIAEHEAVVMAVTYNVLFTNDLVCSLIIDLRARLQKSPLFRHQIKNLMNRAHQARRDYEVRMNQVVGNAQDFLAGANDVFTEAVQHDIDMFYYAIKEVYDKHAVPNSELMARVELTRAMCELACLQLDKRIEEVIAIDPQFRMFNLDHMRMTVPLAWLNELSGLMPVPKGLCLNTERAELAVKVLSVKLFDGNLISKAISA